MENAMENAAGSKSSRIAKKIRDQFITGFLILAPVGITIWILVWIFLSVDNILQPILTFLLGQTIPGAGFGITVLLIYIVGATAGNIDGKRLILYGQHLLAKLPVFRPIYTTIKQIT
jgi:uncharacterized membrane protein